MTASGIGPPVLSKENIDAFGARFLNRRGRISDFLVIYRGIKPDLPTPLKLVFATGNGDHTTACQLGDLPNELANLDPSVAERLQAVKGWQQSTIAAPHLESSAPYTTIQDLKMDTATR